MSSLVSSFIEFALTLEELKSYVECRNYSIRARFGDIFAVKFKDPNEILAQSLSRLVQRSKSKKKARYGHPKPESILESSKQTVTIASTVDALVSDMRKYPVELSLYNKDDPHFLGLAEVPWSPEHIDYVSRMFGNPSQLPLLVKGKHTVFDEYTSRRVAVLKLTIRVSRVTNPQTIVHEPQRFIHELQRDKPVETGTIRTIYFGGKNKNAPQKDKPVSKPKIEITEFIMNNNKLDNKCDNKLDNKLNIKLDSKLETVIELDSVETNPSSSSQSTIIEQPKPEKVVSCVPTFHKNFLFDRSVSSLILNKKVSNKISCLVRSQTDLGRATKLFAVTKHWSSSSVEVKERLDTLNYIFGNLDGPFGNQVYCVGYFTVTNDNDMKDNSKDSSQTNKSCKTSSGKPDYEFPICSSSCKFLDKNTLFQNIVTTDLPEEARHLINIKKCTDVVDCEFRREPEDKDPIEPILLDFTNVHNECCVQKIEEVTGGVKAKMKVLDDPCYCTCECTFGFIKKTMYCNVCGGYEVAGEEMKGPEGREPFPCPVYIKAKELEKERAKAIKEAQDAADRGGEPVVLDDGPVDFIKEATQALVKEKAANKDRTASRLRREKEEEKKSEIDDKKKLKIDPRFQFNYGYKGIPPKIGHKHCFEPCGGASGTVPKGMGWLWTASNIPGLPKHRVAAGWKPGACNKHVVHLLKVARFPEQEKAKRKRKEEEKSKKFKKGLSKQPLLSVVKKDGEYTIAMQTMKIFNKPRNPNQYPYEDRPPVKYVVGRTDEENAERKKRRDRAARRLQREQKAFIQSAFQDMCKEICLKTYQQALGILPYAEDPLCTCFPPEPGPQHVDLSHSCSCSESTRSSGSATDDDEWIVEVTPPIARFDPEYKVNKVLYHDTSSQYTYLDYRVKLLDRFGNPVPRFFIGPDGKQECSDLGGFWGPNKKWLEINSDGIIAPDGRWAPYRFIGPEGDEVQAEDGKFQTSNGDWLVVGVDGYVDSQNRWQFYPKKKSGGKKSKVEKLATCGKTEKKPPPGKNIIKPSDTTWSCFGDASPKALSQMGISGHGHDRRLLLSTLEKMMERGKDVKLPGMTIPRLKYQTKMKRKSKTDHKWRVSDFKCKHRTPSTKGVIAVNEYGHKTYFTLQEYRNPRPKERLTMLNKRGISFSSFHVPCFNSFINSEVMRKKRCEHIRAHNARVQSTQT